MTVLCTGNSGYSKVFIVFRYDDFSGDIPERRSEEPVRQEIWEKEKEMDGIFKKHNMPYHLAIIPERKSGDAFIPFHFDHDKMELVTRGMEENRIEVSQHGFRHSNHVKPGHRAAEFRERSYAEQMEDIKAGKQVLEDAFQKPIDIFVPPYNGWNFQTGNVLTQLNYRILSADRYYDYTSISDLVIIPYTALLSQIEHDLLYYVEDVVIVVLFHPSELIESRQGAEEYGITAQFSLDRLDTLLSRLERNPDIEVTTFKRLTETHSFDYDYYKDATKQYLYYYFMFPVMGNDFSEHKRLIAMPLLSHVDKYRYLGAVALSLFVIASAGGALGSLIARGNVLLRSILIGLLILLLALVIAKVYGIYSKGFCLTIKHVGPALFISSILLANFIIAAYLRIRRRQHHDCRVMKTT